MDAETRDKLPDWQFAGPHRSFPINSQEDVEDAARLIGHAEDPTEVRRNIIKIAKKLHLKLPKTWTAGEATQDDIYDALTGIHDMLLAFLERMSPPANENNSFTNPPPFHVEGVEQPRFAIDDLKDCRAALWKEKDVIIPKDGKFVRIGDNSVKTYNSFEEAYNAE